MRQEFNQLTRVYWEIMESHKHQLQAQVQDRQHPWSVTDPVCEIHRLCNKYLDIVYQEVLPGWEERGGSDFVHLWTTYVFSSLHSVIYFLGQPVSLRVADFHRSVSSCLEGTSFSNHALHHKSVAHEIYIILHHSAHNFPPTDPARLGVARALAKFLMEEHNSPTKARGLLTDALNSANHYIDGDPEHPPSPESLEAIWDVRLTLDSWQGV